jgi:hypothetical protein
MHSPMHLMLMPSCFSLFLNYWWLECYLGNIKLLSNNRQLINNSLHEGIYEAQESDLHETLG